MDLYKAIRELYQEKEKLDQVISSLEELEGNASTLKDLSIARRRGRKSMSPQERRAVSERMKRYWEKRRASAMGKASVNGEMGI